MADYDTWKKVGRYVKRGAKGCAIFPSRDVCEDMLLGKGNMIALHLKETRPGVFREVPFLTGHVDFEAIIHMAWNMGIRRYVTELWDVGQDDWKEAICFANQSMRCILDKQSEMEDRKII